MSSMTTRSSNTRRAAGAGAGLAAVAGAGAGAGFAAVAAALSALAGHRRVPRPVLRGAHVHAAGLVRGDRRERRQRADPVETVLQCHYRDRDQRDPGRAQPLTAPEQRPGEADADENQRVDRLSAFPHPACL